jgi:hypothetical protein
MSTALDIALAYHTAWTTHDSAVRSWLADDVVFDAPAGRLDGPVVAGRIIFDRLPFALARGEVSRAG